MTSKMKGWAAPIYLALCLLLGGASGVAAGVISNAILQFLAVILILVSLWTWRSADAPAGLKSLALIIFLFLVVALLSLAPLPASVWEQLPGRAATSRGLAMLGIDDAALPLSLSPHGTMMSLLWLLPPVAVFLLVLQSSARQRQRLPWVVLVVAVVSVAFGAAQLLAGPDSRLRLYEITNPTLPVGFFANANHLATLILCALPLSGYLAARAVQSGSRAKRGSGMALAGVTTVFFVIGIAIIGSLAGYGLFLVSAMAALLIYRRAAFGKLTARWLSAAGAIFLLFVALAFVGPLQEQALSGKLTDQPTSRKVIAQTTVEAIKDFFPVGTGLGSYADVYRTYDDPDRVNTEYVNHAHNDYLEIAFELGLPGVFLILFFLLWWLRSSLRAWRSDYEGANLARAGSVIIAIVLLHSLVDYPIRTSAIAAVFAMACALVIRPMHSEPRKPSRKAEPELAARHLEAD